MQKTQWLELGVAPPFNQGLKRFLKKKKRRLRNPSPKIGVFERTLVPMGTLGELETHSFKRNKKGWPKK